MRMVGQSAPARRRGALAGDHGETGTVRPSSPSGSAPRPPRPSASASFAGVSARRTDKGDDGRPNFSACFIPGAEPAATSPSRIPKLQARFSSSVEPFAVADDSHRHPVETGPPPLRMPRPPVHCRSPPLLKEIREQGRDVRRCVRRSGDGPESSGPRQSAGVA